jgi:Mor family transcriptional regulator
MRFWHLGEWKPNLLTFEPVAAFLEITGRGRSQKTYATAVCPVCLSVFGKLGKPSQIRKTCSKKCAYILRHQKRKAGKGYIPKRIKVTQEMADGINIGHASGETNLSLSKRFRISPSHIHRVIHGQIISLLGYHHTEGKKIV